MVLAAEMLQYFMSLVSCSGGEYYYFNTIVSLGLCAGRSRLRKLSTGPLPQMHRNLPRTTREIRG